MTPEERAAWRLRLLGAATGYAMAASGLPVADLYRAQLKYVGELQAKAEIIPESEVKLLALLDAVQRLGDLALDWQASLVAEENDPGARAELAARLKNLPGDGSWG